METVVSNPHFHFPSPFLSPLFTLLNIKDATQSTSAFCYIHVKFAKNYTARLWY
jgi:hypothetical protein